VLIEENEFGDPGVVSVKVLTSFFTRKVVVVDGTYPFPPDLVVYTCTPILQRHRWRAQGSCK
jgi:hypothetical protein